MSDGRASPAARARSFVAKVIGSSVVAYTLAQRSRLARPSAAVRAPCANSRAQPTAPACAM